MTNFYWSATKVNVANYCDMKFFLRYFLKKEPLRLSAYVKGSLLHSLIENFWEKLGTPEEAVSTSKKFKNKKYFDAESFAKYAQGLWKRIIVADKNAPKISWSYKEEPWVIVSQMEKICIPLFNYFVNNPRPLFKELPFDFKVGNERFKGRIDEIRVRDGKIILRDYKSGYPWVGEMKLKHDPQLTLYNAGVCARLHSDLEFVRQLGLEGKIDEFMAGNSFVSPNLSLEFFMIEALGVNPEKVKSVPNPINSTSRKDTHFYEVLKMVEGTKRAAETGDIHPEFGKKCDICDEKRACDEESEKIGQGWMEHKGNLSLEFIHPEYIKRNNEENTPPILIPDAIRVKKSKGKREKDPNQMGFKFRYN